MAHPNNTRPQSMVHTLQPVSCPVQLLVIDRCNGAADIFADTLSRLLPLDVTLYSARDQASAIEIMDQLEVHLVIIGIEHDAPDNIALAPYICNSHDVVPILVVGHQIHHRSRARAYEFGADEVITLPRRAHEMKMIVEQITQAYLEAIH